MIDKRIMYYRGGAAQDMGNAENQAASAAAAGSSGTTSGNNDGGYTGPNMADIAGPVTSSFTDADDTRQNYRTDQYTTEPKTKDTDTDETTLTFAPKVTKKTPLDYVKQILSVASILSPHTLVGKIGLGLTTYDKVKTGLQTVSSIADTFGINTDSITNSLSNNFSGKKSNTTTNTNTNNGGDGEGLASLENQSGSYDEYVLLLQKLQSGNISDVERTRYTMLKNMLGI